MPLAEIGAADHEENERPDHEDDRRDPGPGLPCPGRVARDGDRGEHERDRDEAEERDPALEEPQLHRSSSRASAQRAWRARTASPPSACTASAPRTSGSSTPAFPSATMA